MTHKKIGVCHYHLCGRRTKVYLCKFCKDFYCREHIKPKVPGFFPAGDRHSNIDMHDWRESGHPDSHYARFKEKKEQDEGRRYEDALTRLTKGPVIKHDDRPEYNEDKEEPPQLVNDSKKEAGIKHHESNKKEKTVQSSYKEKRIPRKPIKFNKKLIKRAAIGTAAAFIIIFIFLSIQQTEGYQTTQQRVLSSAAKDFYYGNISIENYSKINTPKYFNNASILGFLRQDKIAKDANFAILERYITDSYGNKIKLSFGVGKSYDYLFPANGITTETYLVNGTLRVVNNVLSMSVYSIESKERTRIEFEFTKTETQSTPINVSGSYNFNISYGTGRLKSIFGLCGSDERSYNLQCIKKISCNDGSFDPECSSNKPLQCVNGILINNSAKCDCPKDSVPNGNSCRSILCQNGTREPECSSNKPYQCINNTLIQNSDKCGCPPDYKKDGNSCKKIQRCSDGTIYDECSNNMPLFCSNGNLVGKASKCGCSLGSVSSGDNCVSQLTKELNDKVNSIDLRTLEFRIFDGINAERTQRGLSALKWNEKISEAARKHSKEMADNNYFMHEDLNCNGPDERIVREGVFRTSSGENIFGMPLVIQSWYTTSSYSSGTGGPVTKRDYRTFDQLVEETVQGWMNSPGHRANILTADFDETGIGIAVQNVPQEYVYSNTTTIPILTVQTTDGTSCAFASKQDKEATFYISQDFISTQCSSDSMLCNGQCWQKCDSGSEFSCTSQGGKCTPTTQQGCESDSTYCNGQCWQKCPLGYTFYCTSSGGVCQ